MPSRRQLLCCTPLLSLGLSSCALMSSRPADRIFALTPLPPAPVMSTRGLKIAVAEPTALRVLDTARIANRSGDLEFRYYSGAIWEDRAPTMLQQVIIASLRNRLQAEITTDQFNSMGMSLASDLEDFQIEPGNQIHITLVCSFAGATKTFETHRTAASDKMTDLVMAFDAGTHEIVSDIVEWVATAR